MCILMLAWRAHPRYRLIVAANRDEFHDRPADPLAAWPAPDAMLAGRDRQAGGTWLGIDRQRRFGVITNYREHQPKPPDAPSRGSLIPSYLRDAGRAGDFLHGIESQAHHYSGFNLLLSDADALWYGSNRDQPFARQLEPGVYGLANERLDSPWPKLLRVRANFEHWLRATAPERTEARDLFELLDDRRPAVEDTQDDRSDSNAVSDRALSAPFVEHPRFGTRCSTVLLLEASGALLIGERRFDRFGQRTGHSEYRLEPDQWC